MFISPKKWDLLLWVDSLLVLRGSTSNVEQQKAQLSFHYVKSDERHETIRHEHSDRRLQLKSELQNTKFLYEFGRG